MIMHSRLCWVTLLQSKKKMRKQTFSDLKYASVGARLPACSHLPGVHARFTMNACNRHPNRTRRRPVSDRFPHLPDARRWIGASSLPARESSTS